MAAVQERNQRKRLEGTVVSAKMNKTRVVTVERRVRHPFYEKIVKKSKKFYVHDEENKAKLGDLVEIVSMRPLSKTKRWRLVRIVKEAVKVS